MQRCILRGSAQIAVILLFFLTAVQTAWADVSIERINYKGWAGSYRLTNGVVEVVVVPSVGGRIMRYAFVGGPNALWENPAVAGKPIRFGEWPNTGGEKVWLWSQDDWDKIIGRSFPPPTAADQAPHQAEIVGRDTLRLTSSVVVPWGLRIVRDIRLSAKGTEVFTSNRFVQAHESAITQEYPVALWTVMQVPATSLVFARLKPEAAQLENSIKPMGKANFTFTRPQESILQAAREPRMTGKFGTDADLLAGVVNGSTLVSVRFATGAAPADNTGAAYQPGERAQVYAHPDDPEALKKGFTPYVELELTSPRKALKPGETLTMNHVWSLRKLPDAAERTPEAVATLLTALR